MSRKFLILLLFLVISVFTLFFLDFKQESQTILIVDVDQVIQNQQNFFNRELRLRGFVKPGSILRMGNKAEFVITHNQKEIPVFFNGKTQIPDTFGDGVAVRIDGKYLENGKFLAHKIEAKCASKYEVPHDKNLHYETKLNL